MGGCASKPREVDGDAPEITLVALEVTPAAVTEVVVTETNESKEPKADLSQPAEVISSEKNEEVTAAVAEEAAPSAGAAELVVVEEAAEKGEEKAEEAEAPKTE